MEVMNDSESDDDTDDLKNGDDKPKEWGWRNGRQRHPCIGY
jgi:hypothetical protein